MKEIKIILSFFCVVLFLNCSQQKARRPITQTSNEFIKQSIERNKKLNKGEEDIIDSIIKSNPQTKYIASKQGFYYYYKQKTENDTLTPKKGDVANFDYEVKNLAGAVIYSAEELGNKNYMVDKENIMKGLRVGIKLMHKGDKIVFLFPSNIAYGYHGDEDKIGANIPLICEVTLNNFKLDVKQKIKKISNDTLPIKKQNIDNERVETIVKPKKKLDEVIKENKTEPEKTQKTQIKTETKKEIPSEIKLD